MNAPLVEELPEAVFCLMDYYRLSTADFQAKYPDKARWGLNRILEWIEESL